MWYDRSESGVDSARGADVTGGETMGDPLPPLASSCPGPRMGGIVEEEEKAEEKEEEEEEEEEPPPLPIPIA